MFHLNSANDKGRDCRENCHIPSVPKSLSLGPQQKKVLARWVEKRLAELVGRWGHFESKQSRKNYFRGSKLKDR